MHRYAASADCNLQQQRSGGQNLVLSTDGHLAVSAGYAVCNAPAQQTQQLSTCCGQSSAEGLTGYFWQGAPLKPLGIPGPVTLEPVKCCAGTFVNTYKAQQVLPNIDPILVPESCNCAPPGITMECCLSNDDTLPHFAERSTIIGYQMGRVALLQSDAESLNNVPADYGPSLPVPCIQPSLPAADGPDC